MLKISAVVMSLHVTKIHCLTGEFHGKFQEEKKNDIARVDECEITKNSQSMQPAIT